MIIKTISVTTMKVFKKSNDILEHALEFEKLTVFSYQFMQLSL